MTNIHPKDYAKLVSEQTPHSRHIVGCLRAFWVWICLGTTLTGVGVYDRIGHYAGAGSIVPITGFANSVAAPALEFRREGMILGLGAKLFTLAGPVLVYGISASVLVGFIYWILKGWLL